MPASMTSKLWTSGLAPIRVRHPENVIQIDVSIMSLIVNPSRQVVNVFGSVFRTANSELWLLF